DREGAEMQAGGGRQGDQEAPGPTQADLRNHEGLEGEGMITLAQALLRMPPDFYLKIQSYEDEEEEGLFYLGATVMQQPPEGGWTIPTYFNEPPGVKRAH